MEIRPLKPQEADAYFDMRLKALNDCPEAFASSYEEEKHEPLENYKKRLQSEYSLTLGAFDGPKLMGVVTLMKAAKFKMRHRASLLAMYVIPEKRGEGVGKALVAEAIKKAVEMEDIEQINLAVVTTNEPAKRLYTSLGFEVYGTEKRALKLNDTYVDEDHMVLFL